MKTRLTVCIDTHDEVAAEVVWGAIHTLIHDGKATLDPKEALITNYDNCIEGVKEDDQ